MEENNKRIAEEIINFIKSNYKTLKEEKTITIKVNDKSTLDYTIYPFEIAKLKLKNISSKASVRLNDEKSFDITTLLYFRIMKNGRIWWDNVEVNDEYFNHLYNKFLISLNFILKKK